LQKHINDVLVRGVAGMPCNKKLEANVTDPRSPYRTGALFVLISAALHFLAPTISQLSSDGMLLLPFGILYGAMAWGLMRNWRWLAYVSFLTMLIGTSAALTGIWAASPVPSWVYLGIVIANFLAALSLFVALWRPRPTAPSV